MDDKALRRKVQSVVEVQSQLRKEVLNKVQANRGMQRVAASRGNSTNFAVGVSSCGSGAAQKVDAEIAHDADGAVMCGGSSTTAHIRLAEHRIRRGLRRPCCSDAFLRGCCSRDHCQAEEGFSARFHASRV